MCIRDRLDTCPHILRWTIAPELPGAREMGLALLARGVLPSIGHSEADSEAVRAAIPCGYRHVTHLYSAMSTIVRKAGFRHAGIVESCLLYTSPRKHGLRVSVLLRVGTDLYL